jgi:hypothetical protein
VPRAAAKSRVELNPRNHLQVWNFKTVDFATGLELEAEMASEEASSGGSNDGSGLRIAAETPAESSLRDSSAQTHPRVNTEAVKFSDATMVMADDCVGRGEFERE